MTTEDRDSINRILDNIRQTKQAFQPGTPPAPPMDPTMAGGMPPQGMPPQGMPMDPAMMAGGMPPMDPAMAGGMPPQAMPPMDPAMAGGMPMDPSMAAGAPPQGGISPEVEEILTNMAGGMESMIGFMEELRQRADNAEAQNAELGARLQAMEAALTEPQPIGPMR